MKKRITFFTAIILFSAAVIFAQGGTTGPLTWNLDDGTLTINGSGAMPDYEFGEAPWYPYRTTIYTVVLETGVTTIGMDAFLDCANMTSVAIPTSVITIGFGAFYRCYSITSVVIPDGITTIGEYAFGGCKSLISFTIPNTVTAIESFAFLGCKTLPSIIIPNSVTTIGEGAFEDCNGLTSITLSNNITVIKENTFENCLSLSSIIIPDGVTTIENGAFSYCKSLTSVTIPNSVTTIGVYAFLLCQSLPSITIPNSVTTIGESTFQFCTSLTSVTLSNSITAIEQMTFWLCESLTSITIPDGVTKIGIAAFEDCTSLPSINIPNSVTTIERTAFSGCTNLLSVTIPSSVTKIGDYIFSACTSLTSIEVESGNNHYTSDEGVLLNKDKTTLICYPLGKAASAYLLPSSVTKIENGAFAGCVNLTSIEVENGSNSFASENGVLFNKDKTTLVCYPIGKPETSYMIPNSVTTIGYDAFSYCPNLTSMTIPNNVTKFGERAFSYCTNLSSVTFPKSVKSFGYAAFWGCTSLTSMTNLNLKPLSLATDLYVFSSVPRSAILTVPTSAVSAYQKANVWKEFNIVGGGILVNPVANNSKYGYTTGDGLYQEGEMATVTATAYENCKFVNWTKNGVEVSRENTYIFFVTEDVELVAVFEEIVGIVETDNYPSLRVYPNPTTGEFKVSGFGFNVTGIEIFDMMGKHVQSLMFNVQGSGLNFKSETLNFETVIGISHLPAGIYFIRIQTEKGTVTRKVVKN